MKALISTKYFLKFLKLFGEKGVIDDLQIGDTLYKKEGWIDKSILKGNHTIEGILELDYKFNGIQCFIGTIDGFNIKMKTRTSDELEFIINSDKNNMRKLEYKIIENNAYNSNIFKFRSLKEYEE